jgi:hypothetical protein
MLMLRLLPVKLAIVTQRTWFEQQPSGAGAVMACTLLCLQSACCVWCVRLVKRLGMQGVCCLNTTARLLPRACFGV